MPICLSKSWPTIESITPLVSTQSNGVAGKYNKAVNLIYRTVIRCLQFLLLLMIIIQWGLWLWFVEFDFNGDRFSQSVLLQCYIFCVQSVSLVENYFSFMWKVYISFKITICIWQEICFLCKYHSNLMGINYDYNKSTQCPTLDWINRWPIKFSRMAK